MVLEVGLTSFSSEIKKGKTSTSILLWGLKKKPNFVFTLSYSYINDEATKFPSTYFHQIYKLPFSKRVNIPVNR